VTGGEDKEGEEEEVIITSEVVEGFMDLEITTLRLSKRRRSHPLTGHGHMTDSKN
jgi:hypothetical protein